MWVYLSDLRSSEGCYHVHCNLFYDPAKHDGPLLPPAAALAPTLWPQFHLRWACPSEAQAGELESQCRGMAKKFSEIQKVFCICSMDGLFFFFLKFIYHLISLFYLFLSDSYFSYIIIILSKYIFNKCDTQF